MNIQDTRVSNSALKATSLSYPSERDGPVVVLDQPPPRAVYIRRKVLCATLVLCIYAMTTLVM